MTIFDLAVELNERGVSIQIQNLTEAWIVWIRHKNNPTICRSAEGDNLEMVIGDVFAQWDRM